MQTLIAEARARSGLTQEVFARAVGTSRTRLSAYERGRTNPELDTLSRIAKAASLEVALLPRGTARLAEQIDRLREAVGEGDTAWALRLVAELVQWVRTSVVDPEALRADPGLVGHRGWDALVGGVAEMLARELGLDVPAWASAPGRVNDGVWFVSSLRSLWPAIVVATPPALAARGVYLSAESLSGV